MTDVVKVRMVKSPKIQEQAVMIKKNQFNVEYLVDIPMIVLEDCFSNSGGDATAINNVEKLHSAYILSDMSLLVLLSLNPRDGLFLEFTVGPDYWSYNPWSLSSQDDFTVTLPGVQHLGSQ